MLPLPGSARERPRMAVATEDVGKLPEVAALGVVLVPVPVQRIEASMQILVLVSRMGCTQSFRAKPQNT